MFRHNNLKALKTCKKIRTHIFFFLWYKFVFMYLNALTKKCTKTEYTNTSQPVKLSCTTKTMLSWCYYLCKKEINLKTHDDFKSNGCVVNKFIYLMKKKIQKYHRPNMKQWHPHATLVDLCGVYEVKYGIVYCILSQRIFFHFHICNKV
jgi:hypothetical protein